MATFRGIGARVDTTRGTAPVETRKDLAGLFLPSSHASRVGAVPGILPVGDSVLVVGTSGWSYTVRGFHAVTTRGATDGAQLWGNDGDVTVALADDGSSLAAPSSGLSRIDVIYVRHPTYGENADTSSEPVVAVRKGTAASVPVAPSIPTGSEELARNTMTSAATSTSSAGNSIAPTFRRTALRGTPVIVRNDGEATTLAAAAASSVENPLIVWNIQRRRYQMTTDGGATWFGRWGAYTPQWLGSTTNPNVGNGSIVGEYTVEGIACRANIRIMIGTANASGGSGAYSLSLPVASGSGIQQVATGWLITGTTRRTLAGVIEPGSSQITQIVAGTGSTFDSTFALAGNAMILMHADYRAVA